MMAIAPSVVNQIMLLAHALLWSYVCARLSPLSAFVYSAHRRSGNLSEGELPPPPRRRAPD